MRLPEVTIRSSFVSSLRRKMSVNRRCRRHTKDVIFDHLISVILIKNAIRDDDIPACFFCN